VQVRTNPGIIFGPLKHLVVGNALGFHVFVGRHGVDSVPQARLRPSLVTTLCVVTLCGRSASSSAVPDGRGRGAAEERYHAERSNEGSQYLM
jgi:hypothetical protein